MRATLVAAAGSLPYDIATAVVAVISGTPLDEITNGAVVRSVSSVVGRSPWSANSGVLSCPAQRGAGESIRCRVRAVEGQLAVLAAYGGIATDEHMVGLLAGGCTVDIWTGESSLVIGVRGGSLAAVVELEPLPGSGASRCGVLTGELLVPQVKRPTNDGFDEAVLCDWQWPIDLAATARLADESPVVWLVPCLVSRRGVPVAWSVGWYQVPAIAEQGSMVVEGGSRQFVWGCSQGLRPWAVEVTV